MEGRSLCRDLKYRGLFVIALGFVVASCGTSKDPRTIVTAPTRMAESFDVSVSNGNPSLKIQKASLDKEFLLQANLIEQPVAAMGNGLQSRIVAFKRHGDRLFLLEATQGHTVTTDLPQNLVLTSFPILREDPQSIEFDFNSGMKDLFTASDWRAQDLMGRRYSPSTNAVRARHSYLESAELDSTNRLRIRQIALVDMPTFGGTEGQNVEVKYYLSPYNPDPTYTMVESRDMRRHGFFEVAPQLQTDGSTVIRAARFHKDKPIVFAVSANTPPEFKRAVKDGVKYWAPLFGEGQLQVVDAPEGVVAPDPDFHVVQWVPYDTAGFAYADAQMDPRTGQVLHSQIYLTSAFAALGKIDGRRLLKRMKNGGGTPKGVGSHIQLAGFAPAPPCEFHSEEALSKSSLMALGEADVAAASQAAQDYVRTVTAHEVGHVLGLRHNFAGSLSVKNYDLASRRDRFKAYLNGSDPEESVIPSSSVMDYLPFEEDVIVGSRIRRQLAALEYDQKAIGALYKGEKYRRSEIPLFCTDSGKGQYTDCRPFDAGASLIEFSALTSQWAIEDMAYLLIETYVDETHPLPGEPAKEVEEVNFAPTEMARTLIGGKGDVVSGFGDSTRFLAIHNLHPYVSELNKEEVREQEMKYIATEVQRLGGLEKVFSLITSEYYEGVLARVEELLKTGGYDRGIGLAGQTYHFSDADIQNILGTSRTLMKKLPEALVKVDLETMGRIPDSWKSDKNPESGKLAQLLAKRMEEYVLKQKEENAKILETDVELPVVALGKKEPEKDQPKTEKVHVKLPEFFYSYEMRNKAAPLLKAPDSEKGLSWGVSERKDIRERYIKVIKDACGGCDLEKLKTDELKVLDAEKDKEVSRWFIENKKVLDNLK